MKVSEKSVVRSRLQTVGIPPLMYKTNTHKITSYEKLGYSPGLGLCVVMTNYACLYFFTKKPFDSKRYSFS